jgi:hypothetical protein
MARAHWSPTQRACCHRVSRHSRHAPVRTHRQRGRAAGTCRSGRCAQSAQKRVRMRRNECQPDTRDRSHENEGSSAHGQRAYEPKNKQQHNGTDRTQRVGSSCRSLSGATSSLRYITACQPRRLQWVMLMNPSFSNAPISNLLEATRSTELRLARNPRSFIFLRWGAANGVAQDSIGDETSPPVSLPIHGSAVTIAESSPS